jgi:hypothetical protein
MTALEKQKVPTGCRDFFYLLLFYKAEWNSWDTRMLAFGAGLRCFLA